MKLSRVLILFFLSMTLSFATCASPLLVLDMANAPKLPKHFRMTAFAPNNETINWRGFENLRLAGSGQFSGLSLKEVRYKIKTKRFTIIDLRQESHGFLNANAVSWYAPQNAENAKKTPEEIQEAEQNHLAKVAQLPMAEVYKIIAKNSKGRIAKVRGQEFVVHGVSTEEEFVHKQHLKYFRLYVQDFNPPADEQVDRFIQIARGLRKDEWLYVHCRAGVGRATTFMAMYDMLRNAQEVELNDILARQHAIGGKDLRDLKIKKSFKYKAAVNRLNFLENFYQYAKDSNGGRKLLWTEWLAHKKKVSDTGYN